MSDPFSRLGDGTAALDDLAKWAHRLERRHGESPPPNVARAVARAIARLQADERPDAVLAVLEAMPLIAARSNTLRLARLSALERTGRIDELRAALGQIEIAAGDPGARVVLSMRGRHGVAEVSLENLYGPLQRDLGEILRDLDVEPWRTGRLERLADALHALDPKRSMPLEEYRQRFLWGHVAAHFLFSLVRQGGEDTAVRRLKRQLNKTVTQPFDPAPLLAAERGGRGVLLARAHAGVGAVLRARHPKVSLPDVLVAQNARDNGREESVRLATRGDFQTSFLKLVKRVKRTPHQITIFPEGHGGAEHRTFDLLGREVSLGLGAAMLAWHGRAATFFLGTRWRGPMLETYLVEGPVADGGDREAFEAAFHRFYLDRLEEIALGPPENIVGQGGVWRAFLPQEAKLA